MKNGDWQTQRRMTARQFKSICKELGISRAAGGRYIGVSLRRIRRIGKGESTHAGKRRAAAALAGGSQRETFGPKMEAGVTDMNYEYRGYGIEGKPGNGFAVRRNGETLYVELSYDRAKDRVDQMWETSKTLADRSYGPTR